MLMWSFGARINRSQKARSPAHGRQRSREEQVTTEARNLVLIGCHENHSFSCNRCHNVFPSNCDITCCLFDLCRNLPFFVKQQAALNIKDGQATLRSGTGFPLVWPLLQSSIQDPCPRDVLVPEILTAAYIKPGVLESC